MKYVEKGKGLYRGVMIDAMEEADTMFFRYKDVAVPIYIVPLADTEWRHSWRMWIGKYTLGRLDVERERRYSLSGWVELPRPSLKEVWECADEDYRFRYPIRSLSGRITGLLNTVEYGSSWYSPEDLVEFLHEIEATGAYCDDGKDGPVNAPKA